jgi:opacity protein-like surface antigen
MCDGEVEMKNLLKTGIVVLLAVYATVSAAQGSRAGKWEFTLQPQYTDSIDTTSSNGSRAEIDSTFGFGLGFTYNFNDHFALGGDFTWSQADYVATVVPDAANPGSAFTVSGDLETSTLRLNAA